jgi:hypothetical protein
MLGQGKILGLSMIDKFKNIEQRNTQKYTILKEI